MLSESSRTTDKHASTTFFYVHKTKNTSITKQHYKKKKNLIKLQPTEISTRFIIFLNSETSLFMCQVFCFDLDVDYYRLMSPLTVVTTSTFLQGIQVEQPNNNNNNNNRLGFFIIN
jgi:hypothetical protein